MALQKQPVSITFAQGLDTKTDPYQVQIGNFLSLTNSVFTTTGRLTKRNGYVNPTKLPVNTNTTLTTLNDSLVATGADLYSYSEELNQWIDQGIIQPVQLSVQPLVRTSTSQQSPDSAIAASGLVCLAYMDSGSSYYQITDGATGQQVVHRTALPATAVNPRVFLLGPYFIVTFIATVIATPTLQYIAIPTMNPLMPNAVATISSSVSSLQAGYDAMSIGNILFIAWSGGSSIELAEMNNALAISPPVTVQAGSATLMSVTIDQVNGIAWVTWCDSSNNGYTAAYNFILANVVTPTQIITSVPVLEITTVATAGVLSVFYENINNYSYTDSTSNNIRTDFISTLTVTQPIGVGAGIVSATTVMLRSVGLASKAFIASNGMTYMLVEYGDITQTNPADDSNQPSYFLVDSKGNIYMRLAYSNGGGYAENQVLPNVNLYNGAYNIPYQFADFLATVNKGTNNPAGTPSNAIYTQYGINLATFTINTTGQYSSEIASALHLTGGQLWEYDGVKPVEHGFQVWPENITTTWSATGGSMAAEPGSVPLTQPPYYYFYQVTYEWTDAAGNLHRSAPSIPVPVITTGSAMTGSATLNIPTLRLTYKTQPNPVRIVIYRWSVAQQVYYQVTSITSPIINDPTIDSITYVDTSSDAAILGQTILYTTGGVLEDIAAPASVASALFNNRLWLVDAEDRNLLWYSKQVIENVPVEMTDLLTFYVAPTTGAQGSTGPVTALSAMDDKLIIFKKDAIYYINGTGPDNTGSNSSYSDPVFITSTVGCSNPNSIVLMKDGLMFQSDKGIWILGRDLSTQYIGAGVEAYNSQTVLSAQAIPATNQVRFVMNNTTLMYDYFVNQWGTHTNTAAISATLWESAHTYLNSYGQVFQEKPGTYIDGSEPVLMGLTTSWINVAGLQGFERFYAANLLGTYFSPFILDVQLAYNYNPSPIQATLITPDNQTTNWGGTPLWGSEAAWGSDNNDPESGSTANVFSARLFPENQKCESFQVSIQEVYDPSFNQPAGQGLSLSGLLLLIGMKRGSRTQSARKSFG